MTTLPSGPAPGTGAQPHLARQIAESFGVDAERYDRTRPHYPAALVDRIVAASPGREVLDVGAGTGISSRQFQAAGCAVLGVEPGARMAEFWNVFQPPAALAQKFTAVARRVLADSAYRPDGRSPLAAYQVMLDKAADGIRQAGAFGEPEQWRHDWERGYTKAEWLDMMPTQGVYTRLPSGQLNDLLAGTGQAIDEYGGSFTVEFATVAVTAIAGR